ncbi:MAG: DUF4405 domain-containing protein [Proteobacteria bacterium]|jgi:hypothetical protein|nr:DUF4405 domain-containing protein [Pseudomonadota bacterium]NBX47758.1 DUF4405 domain-containing protein [Chloroflexota bacterium]NBQ31700.1 DUF4405 domain-containing protein [Pseudomonadota bacterium]NBQ61653.1 DUF4405 domain-containing protein [Pseudomonadota bacterium]NBT03601.1 DUF4405 domain-containing protein [Pseudomonadota bacterium]
MQSFWARIPLASRLVLDFGMLVAMILLIDPRASGIAVHEWVGIVIAPVLVFHVTLNWPWIVQVTRKLVQRLPLETRINSVLNSLLFIVMVIAIVSGVLISQEALPWMGFNVTGSYTWRGIHEVSSNFVLIIIGAHLAMHWQWIVRTVRRVAGMPTQRRNVRPAEASR